jgi:repressor LexA
MPGLDELSEKDRRAFALIRKEIIHSGESPTLREINEVTGSKSPRSGTLVINRLIKAGLVRKFGRKVRLSNKAALFGQPSVSTIDVPLVGLVACGSPILAEENIEAHIPVSTALARPGSNYFLLRAEGDSMNKAGIEAGSILLVRQQSVADNGDRVIALINDEVTVKVFERANDAVILRPKSTSAKHKPIVLTENCQIQGVVVAALPSDLY